MKHYESTWLDEDGISTFYQGWEPETSPTAIVCLIHGLGEHSSRYKYVAEKLTDSGMALITMDLRGHGKSAGKRGDISNEQILISEISHLLEEAGRRYPEKPCFLYGHSLGGLLVLFHALRCHPAVAGIVSGSPGLRSSLHKQTMKVAFVRVFGSIFPNIVLPSGLNVRDICRDPVVIKKYVEDPLVHDRVSLGFARVMLTMGEWTINHAAEFDLPLLLMHGAMDQITYAQGSVDFSKSVKSNCTLKIWENLFHEIHNEPEKDEVLDYLIGWFMSNK